MRIGTQLPGALLPNQPLAGLHDVVHCRWGDFDPELLLFRAATAEGMVREITGSIEAAGWTVPYLLEAVALPGLSEQDRKALGWMDEVEGQTVAS